MADYNWRIDTVYGDTTVTGETQSFSTSSDAPIVVDTLLDEDDGIGPGSGTSLRDALSSVGTGNRAVITFDPALNGGTISLTKGELSIHNQTLAIDASGLPSGLTIDANGSVTSHRVLSITHPATSVLLQSLTLTGGDTSGPGGGINSSGTLSIHDSTISGNSTTSAIVNGGGIYSSGLLFIHSSTISDNSANGGIINGGGICGGTLSIHSSTISGNSANSSLLSSGGGIYGGPLSIHSSTISGNSATGTSNVSGGGIYGGPLSIHSSTISGNSATGTSNVFGGGIYSDGTLSLHSSIVAVNSDSEANSIFGSYSGSFNIVDGEPMLAPLGNYGGPTQTMALLPGSPAIDAGAASGFDQRGFTRVIGSAADIGAYEFGNPGVPGFDIYARETIPSGLDATFSGDPDSDQLASGLEYAIGSFAGVSDPNSSRVPTVTPAVGGGIAITFGFNPAATIDTRWVVVRTTDLDHSQATVIYRLNGPTMIETTTAGVSAVITADQIIVTDANPPAGNQVFYYLGAIQQ